MTRESCALETQNPSGSAMGRRWVEHDGHEYLTYLPLAWSKSNVSTGCFSYLVGQ